MVGSVMMGAGVSSIDPMLIDAKSLGKTIVMKLLRNGTKQRTSRCVHSCEIVGAILVGLDRVEVTVVQPPGRVSEKKECGWVGLVKREKKYNVLHVLYTRRVIFYIYRGLPCTVFLTFSKGSNAIGS
jgi:hypothetical protein